MRLKNATLLTTFTAFMGWVLLSGGSCDKSPSRTMVDLQTEYGTISLWIYDSTTLHKENFLKLCKSGYYDSLLFHRVINGFMAQAGDPHSRKAQQGMTLGNGGPGYTIEAEFKSDLYHKRGALAAAREADDVNPEKRSSGSQFYIVQGRSFTETEMASFEQYMNVQQQQSLLDQYIRQPEHQAIMDSIRYLQGIRNIPRLQMYIASLSPIADSLHALTGPFKLAQSQKDIYTTVGGAPHLDGSYTVFGEVTAGLQVLDSICAVKTDKFDRPERDVRILRTRVYNAQ